MQSYQSGQMFENHRLLEKAGSGGSGEVWKADFLGQTVALKIFSEAESDRLKPAIEAQYQITHLPLSQNRYFVPFEHIQLTGPTRYIRMKWIEGISLEAYLKNNGKMPVNKALPLAKQILKGLEVLHQQKMIHGDLNPSNIFLPYGGSPLLMDVGLGKPRQLQHSLTEEEDEKGRAQYAYAAPERFQEGVSASADIFSLGKILYVLLTNASPTTVKPLSEFRDLQLPEKSEIERFIFRCLEQDPQQRFKNATEALVAFDNLHYEVRRKSDAKWEPALMIPMTLALLFVCVYMAPKWIDFKATTPEELYLKAETAFQVDRNYREALKLFQEALWGYRSDYRIYRDIGLCYLHLKNTEDAKVNLQKSLDLNPQQGEVYYHLGSLFETQDTSAALRYYEASVQSQYPYFQGFPKIREFYLQSLQKILENPSTIESTSPYQQAVESYEKNIRRAPLTDSKLLFHLGKCFYWLNEIEHARKTLQLALLQGTPDLPQGEIFFYLGLSYQETDRDQEMAYYEQAIRSKPPYWYAYVNMGNYYLHKIEKIVESQEQQQLLYDPIQEAEFNKVKDLWLTKAEKAYLRAIQGDSSIVEAHFGLGNVYANWSHYAKAIGCYQKISSTQPTIYAQALFSTALCYYKMNQIQKGLDLLPQLRAIDPSKAIELEKILKS